MDLGKGVAVNLQSVAGRLPVGSRVGRLCEVQPC